MDKENLNRNYILSTIQYFGKIKISDISKIVNLSRPSVYSHLNILEKEGLIKRKKDNKKKGAPVFIIPIKDKIDLKRKKEVFNFLKFLEENEGISTLELIKNKKYYESQSYIYSGLKGYIINKIFLTQAGKEYLNQNQPKEEKYGG
jgi:DNA-binding MarR family transcriptional regulator